MVCPWYSLFVGLVYLVGLPTGICWVLFRADAPFPIYKGGAVSFSLGALASCILVCGALPFWN